MALTPLNFEKENNDFWMQLLSRHNST